MCVYACPSASFLRKLMWIVHGADIFLTSSTLKPSSISSRSIYKSMLKSKESSKRWHILEFSCGMAIIMFYFNIFKFTNLWVCGDEYALRNLCILILDSFTFLVPSCVTSKVCHIWYTDVAVDTRLNSFLFKAQKRASIAFASRLTDFLCALDYWS